MGQSKPYILCIYSLDCQDVVYLTQKIVKSGHHFVLIVLIGLACSFSSRTNQTAEISPESEQTTTTSTTSTPGSASVGQSDTADAASNQAIEDGQPLVARVDGQPIFLDVYEGRVAQIEQALSRQQPEDELDQIALSVELRQQVLDGLIEQKIIEQQADALGISISPEEVEAEAKTFMSELDPQTEFERWLENNGLTEAAFLADLQSQLIANRVFEHITQGEADQEQKNRIFDEWLTEKRSAAVIEKYVIP